MDKPNFFAWIQGKSATATAAAAVTAVLALSPSPASASGLQQEMNRLFDSMVNVTQPGVFDTQRRGVLSGGRFTMKNKIYRENIFHVTPPSINAGCGGIDFFGGAFSFINAEQLTQLMRAVAANAAGYAFHLALTTMCADCMTAIETFLKKVQELNQYMGNSCQLAQGIVNDLTSGMDIKGKTDASLMGNSKGFFDDFFDAVKPKDKAPITELKQRAPDEYEKFVGNLVWKEFQKNGTQYWFTYGDNVLLEAIMSVTGTVIVQEPRDSAGHPGEGGSTSVQDITTLSGHKVKIKDLVHGGEVEVYSCQGDTDLCLGAGKSGSGVRTVDLKGIAQQIRDVLSGSMGDGGVIGKFANNSGSFTPSEAALMSNLPTGLGALIRTLSTVQEDVARMFVAEAENVIAVSMVQHMISEIYRAARSALATTDSAYKKLAEAEFQASERAIQNEYTALLNDYGSISDLLNKYQTFLANTEKQRYMITSYPSTRK